MEPGVLHSIAITAHASVQVLVEINLKKWMSLMYLFSSCTITVWYGLHLNISKSKGPAVNVRYIRSSI